MKTVLSWSDDVGNFLATTYEFDKYGNETSRRDPAGLTTKTTYDSTFHNLAIKLVEQGIGVLTTQFVAYDQASGELVAKLETDGRLICSRVDGFGRKVETRMKSVDGGKLSVEAKGFLGMPSLIASPAFANQISSPNCLLDPFEKHSYDRFKSTGNKPYLTASTLSYFNEYASGQNKVVQALDCTGQTRIQRSRQVVDPAIDSSKAHVSWKYWTYDSRGNTLFESFPIQFDSENNFEYQPQPSQGTASAFDELGRVLSQTRPSHNDASINVVSGLQYSAGGANVTEKIDGPSPNINATSVELWSAPRSYISINGKEHVIAATNQNGMVSQFQYDILGNMILANDPEGHKETRKYNSLGQLRFADNCYQNTADPASPSTQPAMTYEYDSMGQLSKTINANGETIHFQRDSKGRPTLKTGSDGRILEYKYDVGGKERLSSMTVYPRGLEGPMETKLSFEYDGLARLSSRKPTLADGTEYQTTFQYDWQGQTTKKSYPNGATKEKQYQGSLLSYSQLYHMPERGPPIREVWLDSRFQYSDATGKPNSIILGKASMKSNFHHTFTYDLQAYPLSHNLDEMMPSSEKFKPLVQEGYTYNGANQLAQKLNSVTNIATKYDYDGKRLMNSQIGVESPKNYVYDKAGNLSTKGDITIDYTINGAHGNTAGSTVFDIMYDRAGRMTKRSTQQSTLDFNYDSFGVLASYTNGAQEKTIIISGPDGKTVRRDEPGNGGSVLLVSED